jgi:hypothetical protein
MPAAEPAISAPWLIGRLVGTDVLVTNLPGAAPGPTLVGLWGAKDREAAALVRKLTGAPPVWRRVICHNALWRHDERVRAAPACYGPACYGSACYGPDPAEPGPAI